MGFIKHVSVQHFRKISARLLVSSYAHIITVIKMKNLKFNVNCHSAILSFKKISPKRFSTLKWELIKQNIDEISEQVATNLDKDKQSTLTRKENN